MKTGHAKNVDFKCACCHQPSDYAYTRHKDLICFECIKSGAAAEKFDMKFTWLDSNSDKIDPAEIEELEKRTPGYSSWQHPLWLTHCNQIAQFQGNFTAEELLEKFED